MFNFFKKAEQPKKSYVLINAFGNPCKVTFNGHAVNLNQRWLEEPLSSDTEKEVFDKRGMAEVTADKLAGHGVYGVSMVMFTTHHLNDDSSYLCFHAVVCVKDAAGYRNYAERHTYGYADSMTAEEFTPYLQSAIDAVLPPM